MIGCGDGGGGGGSGGGHLFFYCCDPNIFVWQVWVWSMVAENLNVGRTRLTSQIKLRTEHIQQASTHFSLKYVYTTLNSS